MTVVKKAPAKINLTLEVLAKRDDGYHEVRSVIQTIDLCDSISFNQSKTVEYFSENPEWDAEKSLVSKAVELFRATTGSSQGVSVTVEKHIPMMAGLGGDSSDAAAVLQGLNELWGTGLSRGELQAMAEKLGSDVPFFLYGGTVLVEGRGETMMPLKPIENLRIILVTPSMEVQPGKTGRMFAALEAEHFTDGNVTRKYAEAIERGTELPSIYNVFEKVVFSEFSGLQMEWNRFKEIAGEIHLAGAGPVMFTALGDKAVAGFIYQNLKKQGMRAQYAEMFTPAQ